jgi:hypothetical protein
LVSVDPNFGGAFSEITININPLKYIPTSGKLVIVLSEFDEIKNHYCVVTVVSGIKKPK